MSVKNIYKIILPFLFLAISGIFAWKYFNAPLVIESNYSLKVEKIRIAACPTCYEIAQKLDSEKYDLIPTASTAESIALLASQGADMMLAGRTLKQDEPDLPSLVLMEGYSFLGQEELMINVADLVDYDIYTDLEKEELEQVFGLLRFNVVDDVYQYLDDGVIITSWENTDFSRSEIVHVLDGKGDRVRLSRRPTLYCPHACGQEAEEIVSLLK